MPTPEFMSPEHILRMNRLLAESVEVRHAAAALGGRHSLTYRLGGAPNGVEYWTFEVSDSGARFLLGKPVGNADVTVSLDWHVMMRTARAEREGGEPPASEALVTGDVAMMAQLQQVLEVARTVATMDSDMPEA